MTQPRTPQDWSIRLAVGLLAVSTVLAPLLFGGVLGWTVPVLASFAAASVLASAFAAWRNGRPLPQGLLLLTFVAATLWTVLQAVPVPCGLVEWIAPDSFEHVSRTAAVFGTDERCTITQDPGRTREEVLKGLTLVSLLVSASLVGALRRRDTLIQIVVIACSALAVVAVAHALADAPAIWGMYRPTNGSAALGPFVNPNHLGGLMALGAPAAFGLGTSSRQRTRRFQWMGAGVLLLGVLALTMSRGAVLAGLAGLGLFGALTARHNVEHVRADGRTWLDKLLLRPMTLAALPVVGAAFVIAGVAGLDRVQRELGETDVGKLELAARALVMAATGPWVGVGRGAFGVAFVERTDAGRVRFEYAESFPAQWAVDWGIVVGPIIVIALGIVLIRAVRQADHPHLRGAVAGVCAYAIQNLVDFGLEELGSAAVAVVLLASVATSRASSTLDLASARRSVASAIVAGGLTVLGIVLLGPSIAPLRVESSRAELERTLASNDRDAFARVVRQAATAHPREPIFPLLAAAEAERHGDASTLTFVNRVMQLAPSWIAPRLVAARFLAGHGHYDQALLEAREALERDPDLSATVACALLSARPSAEHLLRLAARNEHRLRSLAILVECLAPDAPEAEAVNAAILEEEPGLVEARVRLIGRAIVDRRYEAGDALAGEPDEREDPRLTLARARLLLAEGHTTLARDEALRAEHRLTDPWAAVTVRVNAAASGGDWAAMRDSIGELRGLAGSDLARLAEADMLLGSLERAAGHRGQALAAYEDAWRSFERLDALEQVVQIAEELGDRQRARAGRQALCEHDVTAYCAPSE